MPVLFPYPTPTPSLPQAISYINATIIKTTAFIMTTENDLIEVTPTEFEALNFIFSIPKSGKETIYKNQPYAKLKIQSIIEYNLYKITEHKTHWFVNYRMKPKKK